MLGSAHGTCGNRKREQKEERMPMQPPKRMSEMAHIDRGEVGNVTQVESPTYTPTRIGRDGDGILYVCWSGGRCYEWSALWLSSTKENK